MKSLGAEQESVFAAMRAIGKRADDAGKMALQLRPKYGFIGLGSADFDYEIKSQVLLEFLSLLRRGQTPESAADGAKEYARMMVKKWNTNGSKFRASVVGNYELHRWEGTMDSEVETASRNVRNAAAETDVPHVMVAGTRSFTDFGLLCERMNRYTADLGPMVLCTGEWRCVGYGTPGYVGADLLAEQWAHQVRKCPVRQFPPEFDKFPAGKRNGAFHKRNADMVKFVAGCRNGFSVLFWDGKSPGTASVIELLKTHNVPYKLVRYKE